MILTDKEFSYKEYSLTKKNGKFRRICAPSKDLLKYQQDRLPMLYGLFEELVEEYQLEGVFHGFLPNKNCVTAATRHIGFQTTIMMDIDNFFDSVTSKMIVPYDSASSMDANLFHKDGTCAQGFATSPILANIAIVELMNNLDKFIRNRYGGREHSAVTIYADDIAISINSTNKHEIKNIVELVTSILTQEGLLVNPRKTRVRFAKYGRRKMLGLAIGDTDVQVPRKTRRKIRAAKHQGNGPSLGGLTTWSKCMLPKSLR